MRLPVMIVVLLTLLFTAVPQTAGQPDVCGFYGMVTINGDPVSKSTYIIARIGDDDIASTSAIIYEGDSFYEIPVAGSYRGEQVTFVVGEDELVAGTAPWIAGENILLDLTAVNNTIYVKQDAVGDNSGSSWSNACNNLQLALTQAGSGMQIWVAAGTYTAALPGQPHTRNDYFQMKNGVSIYGGFRGTENDLNQRDWETNRTILSAEIGNPGTITDNCYQVFYHPGSLNLNSTAVLDGFTISGGYADGPYPHNCGGGMNNWSSSPTLMNCVFSGNSALGGGGIDNNNHSSPELINCTFLGNEARNTGGAISNWYYSSPDLVNCSFINNTADQDGGGIASTSLCSPNLTGCSFSGNQATYGGGMWMYHKSNPVLIVCVFSGNAAHVGGGGIFNDYGSPVINGCRFTDNTAYQGGGIRNVNESNAIISNCSFIRNEATYGGGISNSYCSSAHIANSVFSNNTAYEGGGISNLHESFLNLINCTFWENSADLSGGALFNQADCPSVVTNSIIWASIPEGIYSTGNPMPMVTYSNVQGSYSGIGNINGTPVFVNPGIDDFHLSQTSPCIDAGDNSASDIPVVDFEGDARIINGVVDMGADEYQPYGELEIGKKWEFIYFVGTTNYGFNEYKLVQKGTPGGETAYIFESHLELESSSVCQPTVFDSTYGVNSTGKPVYYQKAGKIGKG